MRRVSYNRYRYNRDNGENDPSDVLKNILEKAKTTAYDVKEKGTSFVKRVGMTNIVFFFGIPIFWLVVLLIVKPWVIMSYPARTDEKYDTTVVNMCSDDKCSQKYEIKGEEITKAIVNGSGKLNILKLLIVLVALTLLTYGIMLAYYFLNGCNKK